MNRWRRRGGQIGLIVGIAFWLYGTFIQPDVNAGISQHFKRWTFDMVHFNVTAQQYVFLAHHHHLLARALFLLGILVFYGVFPATSLSVLYDYLFNKQKGDSAPKALPALKDFPETVYYANLRRFILTVDQLRSRRPIPEIARKQLVNVIRLFEGLVTDILGQPHRTQFRMLWIVAKAKGSKMWARAGNRLLATEERIVKKCLDVAPDLPYVIPDVSHDTSLQVFGSAERMQALVIACNDARDIGFVLAIDDRTLLTDEAQWYLKRHLRELIHLWDLDLMRQVMLALEEGDWKEEEAQ